MEKFYLEKPSVDRKREIMEYINELAEYNSDTNGIGALSKIFEGYTFEQALQRCLNMENKDYAEKWGRCQSRTFLLIRENDNKIVGVINIRWNLSESMLQFGGHIGYGIRPTERRKGYNKINLYLGLKECKKHGITEAELWCNRSNVGSSSTMKALGGVLSKSVYNEEKNIYIDKYVIDVNKSLEKYKDTYGKYC